jgi:hypothetical protein
MLRGRASSGAVAFAEHADIAAERQQAQLPARAAVSVQPAVLAEADGEDSTHPEMAGGEEWPELVDHRDDDHHREERGAITERRDQDIDHGSASSVSIVAATG